MNGSQEELTEKSLFDKKNLKEECISESEEWVVENPGMEGDIFSHFSLINFLHYDFNCIPKGTFIDFADALKLKILDRIMEFEPLYKDQLEVLCKITDGTQTERNQSIITKRMLAIVKKQKMHFTHSNELFYSQNTASQEDLTSKYFSSNGKAENFKESEIKSSFSPPEINKNDRFNEKEVSESDKMKTSKSHSSKKRNNALEEESIVKTPVCPKALFKTNNTVSTSQGEITSKSLKSHGTFHKRNDVHEEWIVEETPPYQISTTKSNVTANESNYLTVESLSNKRYYQETVNKVEKKAAKHAFSNRKTPRMNNFSNTLEEEWTVTSVKNHSYSESGEINKSHHSYSEAEWTVTYPVKLEISSKDTDGYEQRLLAGDCISSGKNQNSNSKERRNEPSHFAVHSMRGHFSDIRNESESNRSNGCRPAAKAEDIPGKKKHFPTKANKRPSGKDKSTFGHFSLIELLNYDVDLMPSDELKIYANDLKLRVLDCISEFEPSNKEELEVLCEITDGNQTDRNQKIICSRICAIVNKTIPNKYRYL